MAQILSFTREPIALDPDTLALAISAYDKAVVDISSTPDVVREVIAKHIIRLIAEGERDAARRIAAPRRPVIGLTQLSQNYIHFARLFSRVTSRANPRSPIG